MNLNAVMSRDGIVTVSPSKTRHYKNLVYVTSSADVYCITVNTPIQKSMEELKPEAIREAARDTAEKSVGIQKEEFQSLGVMADWEGAVYKTMGMLTLYPN